MSEDVPRTFVMVGRMGNGKSATGNSILGRKVFKAQNAMGAVTKNTQLERTLTDSGRIITVIDTPGLYDPEFKEDELAAEIVKCVDLAKDGIHALLLVYKLSSRFCVEEEKAIEVLKEIFGPKIADHMIIVLTAADTINDNYDDEDEDNYATPEQYLARKATDSLKRVLYICRNRYVFFDNRTKDEAKKKEQVQKLLDVVDNVVQDNGGKPFTNEYLEKLQKQQNSPDYAQLMMQMQKMMEVRLRESVEIAEKRMEEKWTLILQAEQSANKIRELERDISILRNKNKSTCAIM